MPVWYVTITSALTRVADPAAVVRRQLMVIVWPWTAVELPGTTQVKPNGTPCLIAGVTSTTPGLAVWFGVIP